MCIKVRPIVWLLLLQFAIATSLPCLAKGLKELQQKSRERLQITWSFDGKRPTFIQGRIPILRIVSHNLEAASSEAAVSFIAEYADIFGVRDPIHELDLAKVDTDELGMRHISMRQVYQGIEVYLGEIRLHLNPEGDEVVAVNNGFVPNIILAELRPKIAESEALTIAALSLPKGQPPNPPRLAVYPRGRERLGEKARLAWLVELRDHTIPARNIYVIDALEGEILDVLERISPSRHINGR